MNQLPSSYQAPTKPSPNSNAVRPPTEVLAEKFQNHLKEITGALGTAILLDSLHIYRGKTFHEMYSPFFSGNYMNKLGVTDVDMSFEHLAGELRGKFLSKAFQSYEQVEPFVIHRAPESVPSDRKHMGKFTRVMYTIQDDKSATMTEEKRNTIDIFDEGLMQLLVKHITMSVSVHNHTHGSRIANIIAQSKGTRLPIFNPGILDDYLAFYGQAHLQHTQEWLVASVIRVNENVSVDTLIMFLDDLIQEELPDGACIISTDTPKFPLEFVLLSPNAKPKKKDHTDGTILKNQTLFPAVPAASPVTMEKPHYAVEFSQPFSRLYFTKMPTGNVTSATAIQPGLVKPEGRLLAANRIKERFVIKKVA